MTHPELFIIKWSLGIFLFYFANTSPNFQEKSLPNISLCMKNLLSWNFIRTTKTYLWYEDFAKVRISHGENFWEIFGSTILQSQCFFFFFWKNDYSNVTYLSNFSKISTPISSKGEEESFVTAQKSFPFRISSFFAQCVKLFSITSSAILFTFYLLISHFKVAFDGRVKGFYQSNLLNLAKSGNINFPQNLGLY